MGITLGHEYRWHATTEIQQYGFFEIIFYKEDY